MARIGEVEIDKKRGGKRNYMKEVSYQQFNFMDGIEERYVKLTYFLLGICFCDE
jgi:hypothetical protein